MTQPCASSYVTLTSRAARKIVFTAQTKPRTVTECIVTVWETAHWESDRSCVVAEKSNIHVTSRHVLRSISLSVRPDCCDLDCAIAIQARKVLFATWLAHDTALRKFVRHAHVTCCEKNRLYSPNKVPYGHGMYYDCMGNRPLGVR